MREKQCFNCGEPLGVPHDREPEPCGSAECQREARAQEREDREERMERARRDDFERY